jgi:hypothetical protein
LDISRLPLFRVPRSSPAKPTSAAPLLEETL